MKHIEMHRAGTVCGFHCETRNSRARQDGIFFVSGFNIKDKIIWRQSRKQQDKGHNEQRRATFPLHCYSDNSEHSCSRCLTSLRRAVCAVYTVLAGHFQECNIASEARKNNVIIVIIMLVRLLLECSTTVLKSVCVRVCVRERESESEQMK